MPLNKRVRRRLVLLSVLVVVIVAALIALFFLSRWNREREVERSTTEGMAAYEAGDYVTALQKLSYVVTHRKENVELALALGDTRLRNIESTGRHLRAAAKYYLHALSLDPSNEEALRALVGIYRELGDIANVLAYSDRLPENDLESIRARISVLGSAGRIEDALVEVARIRDTVPSDPEWVILEFELRRRHGETAESMLSQLDAFEATYPNNQGIPFVRVPLLRHARQSNAAILTARELANLPSIDPGIILALLRQLEALKMRDEARTVLERANESARLDADISYALTERLWRHGAYASALALALEAAEVFNDDLRFLRIAAGLASFAPDEVDPEEVYEKFLAESRSQDTARAQIDLLLVDGFRTRSMTNIADLREGIGSVQAARLLDPRNASLRLVEADLLNRTGQTNAAINAYREVFERSRSRTAGTQLTNLLLQSRQDSDALLYANQLFSLYPNIDIFVLRARAWIGMKRAGQDPSDVDLQFSDGSTVTQLIQNAYTSTRESAPRSATMLLPLLAGAAAVEDDKAALAYAVAEALQNEHTTPAQLLQIMKLGEVGGGARSDELLQLANSRGATPFNIALVLAQQARSGGDEVTALAILDDARGQIDEGSDEEATALRQILTFVASSPDNDDAVMKRLAEIFQELPEDPSAARVVASYPGLWIESPELAQSALDQIEVLLGKGSSAYATSNARRVMSITPDDSAARAEALVALDEVILRSPGSIEAMLLMSDLLRSGPKPDLSGSANYLRRALESRPDQVRLYPTLIQLLQQIGDRERALEYLTRYQEVALDTSAARRRVALFIRQGELHLAIEELRLIAETSKDPLDRIALAQFLAREGRITEALEQYDLALVLDPGNRFALDGKILVLAATGEILDALVLIKESAILNDRERLLMRIEANLAASRLEDAARASDALIQTTPEAVDTWILAGRVRAQTNDLPGARSALRQALEIDPDNSLAIGQLVPLLVARPASWGEARVLLPRLQNSSPALAAVLDLTMNASNPENSSFEPSPEDLTRSQEIIREYPGAIGPRRLAWTLHSTAGDHATALRIARNAMGGMLTNPIPAQWALDSAVRSGDWDVALRMAHEVRDRNPVGRRLEQELQLAELYLSLGRTSDATMALEQFAPIVGDEEAIYLNVPVSVRSADAQYGLIPARLRVLLLRALLMNGRVDRAFTIYGPLFNDHPNLVVLWLAQVPSMEPSDARAALRRIEPATASIPGGTIRLSQSWVQVAGLSKDPRDIETANDMVDRTIQANPSLEREGALLRAQLAEISGDTLTAIAIHRALIDEHTREEIDLIRSFSSLPEEQRRDVALMRRAYATALNNLAYQLAGIDDGNLDSALSSINEALACAPPALRPEFLDTKATVLATQGEYEAALETIELAIDLAPNRVDFRIRAVRILMSLGRPQEARTLAERTLKTLANASQPDPKQAAELRLLIEEIG